jgi:hypothetical protein
VRPGFCAVVFTNNDGAYAAALDLHRPVAIGASSAPRQRHRGHASV